MLDIIIIIIIPNTLGYKPTLPKFAHKVHQYLVPTHLYTIKSNALARIMDLQFTLTTTSLTSSLLFSLFPPSWTLLLASPPR